MLPQEELGRPEHIELATDSITESSDVMTLIIAFHKNTI